MCLSLMEEDITHNKALQNYTILSKDANRITTFTHGYNVHSPVDSKWFIQSMMRDWKSGFEMKNVIGSRWQCLTSSVEV